MIDAKSQFVSSQADETPYQEPRTNEQDERNRDFTGYQNVSPGLVTGPS